MQFKRAVRSAGISGLQAGEEVKRVGLLAVIGVLLVGAASAEMSKGDAFSAGMQSGDAAHTQAVFDAVSNAKGEEVITGYSTTPPSQAAYWGGGQTILNPLLTGGSAKVSECATTGLQAADPAYKQHCEAVDAIAKQPSIKPQNLLTRGDPLLTRGKVITADPGAITGAIDGNYSDCTTTTTQTDPEYTIETCNEWAEASEAACTIGREVVVDPDYNYQCTISTPSETIKCRRGFSADVGVQTTNETFSVDRGSEVPNYVARTFNHTFTLDGEPQSFALTYYRIDNYGQVWVNGTLVYQNVLSGYGDMRNGRIGRGEPTCAGYDESGNPICWPGGYEFFNASGTSYGNFYDDGCNWGCKGVAPSINISSYMRSGTNTITIVCANANSIGPCAVTITGNVKKITFLGSLVDNECAALEARAK